MTSLSYQSQHLVIINLTPHSISLIAPGTTPGDGWTWPAAEGGVARCAETRSVLPAGRFDPFGDGGMVGSLPLVQRSFGAVTGLPARDPGRPWLMYIVTQFVADASPDREDLLVPTDLVRDAGGNIIGCRAFAWRPATARRTECPLDHTGPCSPDCPVSIPDLHGAPADRIYVSPGSVQ